MKLTFGRQNLDCRSSLKAYVGRWHVSIDFPVQLFQVTGHLERHLSSHPDGWSGVIPCLELDDEDPDAFKLLVEWAHTLRAGKLDTQNPLEGARSDDLVNLYVLAHQYKITKLQDGVMKALFKACHSKDWSQCAFSSSKSSLDHLVDKVPEDSKMHQFLTTFLVEKALQAPRGNAEKIMENIPDQLVRLAFTKILKLPACSCLDGKVTDADVGVDDFLLSGGD